MIRSSSCPPWPPEPTSDPTEDRRSYTTPGDVTLDTTEVDLVRSEKERLLSRLTGVVDEYYSHLEKGEFGDLMRSKPLDDLKALRTAHWRLMIQCDFVAIGDHYMRHLGPRLVDGGFPRSIFMVAAEWFALGFGRIADEAADLSEERRNALRRALVKIAFFDLALSDAPRDFALLD